jgi:hypothetical protein
VTPVGVKIGKPIREIVVTPSSPPIPGPLPPLPTPAPERESVPA